MSCKNSNNWLTLHVNVRVHAHCTHTYPKHISNGTIQKYLTNERAVSCSFSFYCCTLSFCFVLACHCLTMQCHTPYAIPYHTMPCLVLWCPFAKRVLRFFSTYFPFSLHSPVVYRFCRFFHVVTYRINRKCFKLSLDTGRYKFSAWMISRSPSGCIKDIFFGQV